MTTGRKWSAATRAKHEARAAEELARATGRQAAREAEIAAAITPTRPRGRPPLEMPRDHPVTVRLTRLEWVELEACAERLGVSPTELARQRVVGLRERQKGT